MTAPVGKTVSLKDVEVATERASASGRNVIAVGKEHGIMSEELDAAMLAMKEAYREFREMVLAYDNQSGGVN